MDSNRIRPAGKRLLVRHIDDGGKTASGLYLLPASKNMTGTVLAIGTTGGHVPARIGDKVVFSSDGAAPVVIDGCEYLIVEYDDVLARLVDEDGENG